MSFLCNSSPEMRACCTISTCLCRMHSQPEHLVNFILFFSPFIFQLHFFFLQFFSLPFSLLIIGEAIFLLVLSVHVFFEWNILEKYKALNYFRNFFSQLNQSTFHFLKHRSLCLWSYILMTRSSDLQTRAIFFFSSFPPPTLFGCRICEVEKNGFHC